MSESNKLTSTQIAIKEIKHLIFSGELVADSNHLESELAARLGLSRTPVRQATLMLEAHGLLEVRPRKGVRIKSVSTENMADIYEIITELECVAAKRAASAGLKKSDLIALNKAIADMEVALGNENREQWAQADEAFHSELVRLGGNQYIEDMVNVVNDQVRRARSITLHMRPLPVKSNEDHSELYSAILKGDKDLAQKIHRQHRQKASEMIISILNKSGLRRI